MYNILQGKNKLELRQSLAIPSAVNSYSMAMEYMRNWFLDKFDSSYFKTIYINEKHISDDFRNFDNTKSLKSNKPSVAITPRIELDFDREGIDNYLFGNAMYIRKGRLDSAFFKDYEHNMFLDMRMSLLKMDFNFKVRVSSRAQQLDLYRYIEMACRIGATQEEDLDMDFHVPYSVMIQIAKDVGFDVEGDRIINILEFISYVNSKSRLPILYKHRTINGRCEFFVRVPNNYVHISCLDKLDYDDGEKDGMVSSNYMIEFNATLKIPAPFFYTYYSEKDHNIVNTSTVDNTIGLYTINIPRIPTSNNKGWQTYLTTECYEDDKTKPLSIEFKELIENTDLDKIISHHIDTHLSPEIFIDFKLFNNGKEVEYSIDWRSLTILTNDCLDEAITTIVIYVDFKYMVDCNIEINELYSNRISKTK
ncbi:MAG: hypothetical protein ACRCXT_03575 [Paraclostridium sp.]